jgi:DNA polymerase-3 subunit delta
MAVKKKAAAAPVVKSSPQVYLFMGPEQGEKDDAIARIRDSLRAKYKAGLEETLFYAGENGALEIAGAVANGALFSDARFFLIKEASLFKKADVPALASAFATLDANTTVILVSDETKVEKDLDALALPQNKKVFWELFDSDKVAWVNQFWRKNGYKITGDAVDVLLDMVENNTEALRQQCGRLMLFLKKDKPVDTEDVAAWLSHTREESPFTLFSAIAAADREKAFHITRVLLGAKQAPVAIFAGLTYCYKRLRDYATVASRAHASDLDFVKIGFKSRLMRRDYDALWKNFHGSSLLASRLLALTAAFDMEIRTADSSFQEILMDMYIYKIFALRTGQ